MVSSSTFVKGDGKSDQTSARTNDYEAQDDVDPISFPDVYSSWNSTSTCDRRLSRAARSLVRQRLLHYIFSDVESGTNTRYDNYNIWDLLDRWLMIQLSANGHSPASSSTLQSSCPLWPSRDVYREEEDHVVPVNVESMPGGTLHAMQAAYPNHVLGFRRSTSPRRPDSWYRCDFCGKIFSTRFYLDLHMSRHHDGHESHTMMKDYNVSDSDRPRSTVLEVAASRNSEICPAVGWCRLVGLANCHEKALQDEPFYDRGSGGWGEEDRTSIQHKWKKVAHSIPCTIDSLHQDCRSILRSCGLIEEPNDDDWARKVPASSSWQSSHSREAEQFCRQLTCPSHRSLWQFFDDGTSLSHARHTIVHDLWGNIWRQEIRHHRRLLSIVGTLLVVGLLAWITWAIAAAYGWRWQRRDTIPAGQRLLYKGRRRSNLLQSPKRGRVSRMKRD
jgi:hypothetical protein